MRQAALTALEEVGDGAELFEEALAAEDVALRGTAVALLEEREHPRKLDRLTEVYDRSTGVEWIEVRETVVAVAAELGGAELLLRRVAHEDPMPTVRAGCSAAPLGRALGANPRQTTRTM